MCYKNLRFVFVLAFSFSLCSSFAQQTNTQEGFKLFFEKVFLHLDRSYYAPGEDIWFKAYLVNAQNNLPFNTSNNLYVELIDPTAAIVSKRVIRMDSIGVGDFHLEDSIAGGIYRIRAYTNWMRNFGNHFIFEKEIYVTDIPQLSKSDGRNKNSAKNNKKVAIEANYKIQFLPESGSMIEGVPTIVAFKAEDANGKGVEAKGYIQSANGDTAAKFRTAHLGMGSFAFAPKAHVSYKAFVQYGKESNFIEVQLPAVLPTGYVMNVENTDADSIMVSIKTNPATKRMNSTGVVNIAARHAGKSYFKQQINLINGKANIGISKKDFPAGIAYITLYDEDMHPNCERLVYVDKDSALNVELTTDKQIYQSREKATISITVTDAQHQPVKTALSLAVVEASAEPGSGDIVSYLMLESDLQGKIENAYSYFDKKNTNRLEQLDLLLRTQGWRSFLWRQIADTTIRISYLPEAGVTISGDVLKPFTNKPMSDMNITLFAPEAKGDKIYLTKTNAQGKYYLDGLPLYGIQNLKINVGDGAAGKRVGEIKMDTLFGNPLPVAEHPFYSIDSSAFSSFEKVATMRWSKFKNNQWSHMLPNVTVKTRGTTLLRDGSALVNFGYPEYNFTITNDDYKYQRLRDFIVQKVPGARYDDELEGVYFLSNGKPVRPILIVNRNQNVFDRLDYYSLSMRQIESVNIRHMVGSPTYSGIENIGNEIDVDNFQMPPGIRDYFLITMVVKSGNANQQLSKIRVSVNGYYEARIFYAPNYSKENPVEEDERITIHWAPLIKTDENGKAKLSFYNADPKTKIKVNVQGLTANGVPVVASSSYEVK